MRKDVTLKSYPLTLKNKTKKNEEIRNDVKIRKNNSFRYYPQTLYFRFNSEPIDLKSEYLGALQMKQGLSRCWSLVEPSFYRQTGIQT